MGHNNITSDGQDFSSLDLLTQVLSPNSTLRREGDSRRNLTYLDVSGNMMGAHGSKNLARIVCSDKSLHLKAKNCSLDGDAFANELLEILNTQYNRGERVSLNAKSLNFDTNHLGTGTLKIISALSDASRIVKEANPGIHAIPIINLSLRENDVGSS